MAAFLGHARQWELFGRRLRVLQRRDKFVVFHATEFKGKSGEFARWSDTKCMNLVHDLTAIVRDHLTEGVVFHLEHHRYMNEYRREPIPKRMSLDSQYGVCFRACIAHLIAIVMQDGKQHLLNVVIEGGHRNVKDVERIFHEMKTMARKRFDRDVLGTFRIVEKKQCPPLMVSDFLAYSYLLMRTQKVDYSLHAPMQVRKKEAGLTFLELLPDALWRLKDQFQKDRQDAMDAWRARRGRR
jgi:hypothetical protein